MNEYDDPFLAAIAEHREQRLQRDKQVADRGMAAIALAPTLTVAQALYRGRRVPVQALDPDMAAWIACWDGELSDDIVLDVLVALEARRAAGEFEGRDAIPEWVWNSYRRRAA